MRPLAVLAALQVIALPAFGQGLEKAQGAFLRESEVTLHLRSYALERKRPGPDLEAWAGGGWLGYQSGWYADLLRLGAVGYSSQKLNGPADKDGTLLLKPQQQSYSVLGQAYLQLKFKDDVFTGYRQSVDQPEVNPQDNRMTPNTFEGYTLGGKLRSVEYFAGYLHKMKTRNADSFRNFASVAGAPAAVEEGMGLAGIKFAPVKDLTLRLSSYGVNDILTSTYGDFNWTTPLSEDYKLRLGGQYMYQTSNGDDLLTGSDFRGAAGGLITDLIRGAATFTLAYTQAARAANYRSPYGSWAGYTSMIVEDFNRAGEKALLLGARYDFQRSLKGLSFNVAAVHGSDAIIPATRANASKKKEYDGTIDYRFNGADWPAVLKPLWIRARGARIEEDSGGTTNVTRDYRLIVNYEWVFK
jgi:hypothetical protein